MYFFIILVAFFYTSTFHAQSQNTTSEKDTLQSKKIDPMRPAKASFYSAILPGLGQVYNKKYWKLPLVYGAIGTSIYCYADSRKQFNSYRNEYKNRLSGTQSNSEYLANLSKAQLISAQKQFQRNSDLSALFIVGFYALNIIDANIDAALSQFNVGNQLSLKPIINTNPLTLKNDPGLSCVYKF